jgi:hypothetical protein
MMRPAERTRPRLGLAMLILLASAGTLSSCSRAPRNAGSDTMSDQAAAESAAVFASMPTASGTRITLAATGPQQFAGPLNTRATCTYSQSGGEQLIQVEGFARDAQVDFSIIDPHEGTAPVSPIARRTGTRIANLDVALHSRHYSGGSGTATITDPLGRRGTLTVHRLVPFGAGRANSRSVDLTVKITWECE